MSRLEIIEQVRNLPTTEKRELVEQIWVEFGEELECVDSTLTPQQTAELDVRLAEFEKNPHDGVSWEQVRADIKKRFGWK